MNKEKAFTIYKNWIENITDKKQLLELKKLNEKEIIDRFSNEINFGTAGIRAKILLGTNYINEYVIAKFTYCFGQVLIGRKEDLKKGIAIFHDNRKYGKLFSQIAAKITSSLNIPVYLFNKENDPSVTPFLSHIIIKKELIGGINITASHNTKEYNGMKFYDSLGKQINGEFIEEFLNELGKIKDYFHFANNEENIKYLEEDVVEGYVNDLINIFKPDLKKKVNFKVIYNSNHGAGITFAKPILDKLGFEYQIVKEQEQFDENFKNAKNPNPQYEDTFSFSKKYGDKIGADILIASDPDADRIGVMVKSNNKWILLNGNELPIIQGHFLINKLKSEKVDLSNYFAVNSIVTSKYLNNVFDKYNVKHFSTITGFSYISDKINEVIKEDSKMKLLFAWEESNGSIFNYDVARDKDFFQSFIFTLMMSFELKDTYKKTLVDYLGDIKKEYGNFSAELKSIDLEKNNLTYEEVVKNVIKDLKDKNLKIKEIIDYKKGYKGLPKKEITEILLEDGSNILIRNSGTEPLIKIYSNLINIF